MGMPMATNLLRAGYQVVAHDVATGRVAELQGQGARSASSAAEIAALCPIVMTMLTDTSVVEQVLFGPAAFADRATAGQVVIDSSSISAAATRQFARRLADKGVTLLDAPVSGGQKGAVQGTLTFMVGGEKAAFERCLPIFETLGSRVSWMGESGAGQITKACNQAIIAVSLLGIAEALLIAARSGVDPAGVRAALLGGFAGSPLLEVQGQRMLMRDFQPGFRAALHYKDLGIAADLAHSVNSPAPAISLAVEMFGSLVARGLGNEDHSAIITALEALGGSQLT
jgi:2-hydroxy-3-oxopropionate reductase